MKTSRRVRGGAAALLLAVAIGAPAGAALLHAQTKCFFKDCLVFPNGTRVCEVREVACPEAT
ncbi:hypothetical protein [Longimicrobium terrae]|uniref:Uncharacterized protein n=1 Tax=Longimicrobium terrae TaxID=1639882 RepID=A0A841H6A1_9BACT|nr:hypothetical protein [Longimicrobium terrae]MBB4639020.1 hypothetical protein [Longimicrobium terrae]MBB6073259.1 hypothetical protein [Longimicrobium terrae]NNC32290.1 hypothetical protein [Longimicrobium terrae]